MLPRLALVLGSLLACLFLWRLSATPGATVGSPVRLDASARVDAPADTLVADPALRQGPGSRKRLVAEDRTTATPRVRSNDASTPAPVAVTDDEHWIEGHARLGDGAPITGCRVVVLEAPPRGASGEARSPGRRSTKPWAPRTWNVLASAPINGRGAFSAGPVPEGTYELTLVKADWSGEVRAVAHVDAPTNTAELVFDGHLVVLEAPTYPWARTSSGSSEERLEIRSTNGTGRLNMGNGIFGEEGRVECLLEAGLGHHFRYASADGRHFEAALGEDAPPGRHHVLLEEARSDPGSVRAVFERHADDPDFLILVGLSPLSAELDLATARARRVRFPLGIDAGETERDSVVPGRYRVRTGFFSRGEPVWFDVVTRPEEIEVRPGEVAEVRIERVPGGRLSVCVEGHPRTGNAEPRLEVHEESTNTWRVVGVQPGEGAQSTRRSSSKVSLAFPNDVLRAFAPGPLRVRLGGRGWRTVEATLTITAGKTTTWRPRLEAE
ncbi:MAG: hypothetical protein AAGB93_03525 [Planctomycetota bacterium]